MGTPGPTVIRSLKAPTHRKTGGLSKVGALRLRMTVGQKYLELIRGPLNKSVGTLL